MDIKEIVAVSGQPGLYELVTTRDDGLVVSPLEGGRTLFLSSRKHDFTPLESITIFTEDADGLELKAVFAEMKKQESETPPPKLKADGKTLRSYFEAIVPKHDRERVYTSDGKKIVKWFNILNEKGLISETVEEEGSEAAQKQSEQEQAAKSTRQSASQEPENSEGEEKTSLKT